jgi:2-iminobutanoate/2-iminopropanoate deaminase
LKFSTWPPFIKNSFARRQLCSSLAGKKTRMKKILLLMAVIFAMQVNAQINTIQKQKFHFENAGKKDTIAGYAQAVKVDNVLYISGSVARDVTPGGIKSVYSTLQKTLEHYGASFQNVVKENLYTTDIEAMKKYNESRKIFYNGDFPAATWIQVNRLFMHDARLEVELIAHLPR